jgi:hypothetical protein
MRRVVFRLAFTKYFYVWHDTGKLNCQIWRRIQSVAVFLISFFYTVIEFSCGTLIFTSRNLRVPLSTIRETLHYRINICSCFFF